jgi:MFS family permease
VALLHGAGFGTRPVQLVSAALGVIGLLLLAQAGASGSYATGVVPGLVLFGVSVAGIGVPAQIAAIADVTHDHAGAASGVVSAVYQVGGALGLAIVSTVSTSWVTHLLATGSSPSDALVAGFHRGLVLAAAFAAVNLLVTLRSPQIKPSPEQIAEASVAA